MNYLYSYIYKRARAAGAPYNFFSAAINAVSKATHTELVFDLGLIFPDNQRLQGKRVSFSNTMADGAGGCRFRISEFTHKDYWDIDTVPGNEENILDRLDEACKLADVSVMGLCDWASTAITGNVLYGLCNKKYDVLGTALSFFSRAKVIKSSTKKGRCSEDCARVIMKSEPEIEKWLDFEELTPDDIQLIVRVWKYGEKRRTL